MYIFVYIYIYSYIHIYIYTCMYICMLYFLVVHGIHKAHACQKFPARREICAR